jgi:hypothetical protein
VSTCCATCGFRSNAPGFFRPASERGLRRWSRICKGCDPYDPSKFERRLIYGAPIAQVIWLGLAAIMSSDRGESLLPGLLLVEAILLSSFLRAIVHEGGHALAARAMGAYVWRVSLGFGPLRRRFRVAGAQVALHRHLFAGGGFVQSVALGGGRLRGLLYFAAGALANGAAAGLCFLASYALGDGSFAYVGVPILTGLGLSQALGVLNLLSFQSQLQNQPSDGRRILGLLRQRPPAPDAAQRELGKALAGVSEHRFKDAARAFEDLARLKPGSPFAFAMVLHYLAQDGGAAEAFAFYRLNCKAIETVIAAPIEEERLYVSVLQANVAWVALEANQFENRALADAYSRAALETEPEGSAALGARGRFLLAEGEAAAASELLLSGIRLMEPGPDRADVAGLLAQASRDQGDVTTAEAFEGLRRYVLKVAA